MESRYKRKPKKHEKRNQKKKSGLGGGGHLLELTEELARRRLDAGSAPVGGDADGAVDGRLLFAVVDQRQTQLRHHVVLVPLQLPLPVGRGAAAPQRPTGK